MEEIENRIKKGDHEKRFKRIQNLKEYNHQNLKFI